MRVENEKTVTVDSKEFIEKTHSKELVELMLEITNLNKHDKFNMLTVLSEPYGDKVIAGIALASIYCIDITDGNPKIDFEKFNRLTKKQKLMEIDALMRTVYSMITSLTDIRKSFLFFGKYLVDIEKKIENED